MEERVLLNGHQLIISKDNVQLKDGIVNAVINIPEQFRFGIQPIDFFSFLVGKKYRIDLKDDLEREISIQLNTYLGFKGRKKLAKYEEILERLWQTFFKQRLEQYMTAIDNNEVVDLGDFHLHRDWIKKDRGEEEIRIDLESAVIIRNWDKLYIRSKFNRKNYIKLDTLKEWNSPFIYSLLDKIMGER